MRHPILSPAAMARLDWVRGGHAGKIGARWRRADGWSLVHCGHPTALRPWILTDPSGTDHRTGGRVGNREFGTTWERLADAVAYVETISPHQAPHQAREPGPLFRAAR